MLRSVWLSILLCLSLFSAVTAQQRTGKLAWKYPTDGKIFGSAVADHGSIFFGSEDGTLHALDLRSGDKIWEIETEGRLASQPAVSDGTLFILSGSGTFYAVNTKDGAIRWTFKTGGEHPFVRHTGNGGTFDDIWDYYLSNAVVDNGKVYFGSSDTYIYALDVETGKLVWKFKTGDVVHAAPVIRDGRLFIGGFDGIFYALDANTGELLWKRDTIGTRGFPAGAVQRAAGVSNGTVYFGSRDFNLYALDVTTGEGFWNYREYGSWIISTPLVDRGSIYFGTSDTHEFYRLDANTGSIKWKLPLNMRVYGSAVPYNGRVFFGCFNGYLYGVDIETGNITWRFQTEGSKKNYYKVYNRDDTFRSDFKLYGNTLKAMIDGEETIHSLGSIMATPLIAGDRVYFGSTDGNFYAVEL